MARDRTYAVVTPTFNRYEECLRAVRSAFAQTVPPTEVVVVDDASDDRRYEWLDEIVDDERLTILRLEENSRVTHGVGYAIGWVRNWALRYLLSGDACPAWIAMLDDDDEWMPGKMERSLEVAGRYEHHRLIATNAINRRTDGVACGYHHGEQGRIVGKGVFDITETLTASNAIICSTAMLGADIARQVGDQRDTGFGEDWDYWQRAAKLTPALFVNEPLAFYTVGNHKHYRY